jgi:hypothetical protein
MPSLYSWCFGLYLSVKITRLFLFLPQFRFDFLFFFFSKGGKFRPATPGSVDCPIFWYIIFSYGAGYYCKSQ